jgi:hypothetical protein
MTWLVTILTTLITAIKEVFISSSSIKKATTNELKTAMEELKKQIDSSFIFIHQKIEELDNSIDKVESNVESFVKSFEESKQVRDAQLEELKQIVGTIKENQENNIEVSLFNAFVTGTDKLNTLDAKDKMLYNYLNSRIKDTAAHYHLFKDSYNADMDVTLLSSLNFKMALLGNPRTKLMNLCDGYTDDFITFIESSNDKDFDTFVNTVGLMMSSSKHTSLLEAIKNTAIKMFEVNIKKIVNKYLDIKDDIKCNNCNKCKQ